MIFHVGHSVQSLSFPVTMTNLREFSQSKRPLNHHWETHLRRKHLVTIIDLHFETKGNIFSAFSSLFDKYFLQNIDQMICWK